MKTLKEAIKKERQKFKIPKSVQDVIPIREAYKDGIFYLGNNQFSKTFRFTDVNYNIASDIEKQELMKSYWGILNSFAAGISVKITINNHPLDRAEFEQKILMPYQYDNLDGYRKEYNQMLIDKAEKSNSIIQDKYFTVTVQKKNLKEARSYFGELEYNLSLRLSRINSRCYALNAEERLAIFHNFYRSSNEENYNLNFEEFSKGDSDIKDYIAPDSMEFFSDYMTINGKFVRPLFMRNYGTYISDSLVSELTSFDKKLMFSIDFVPIPADEGAREVDKVLLGIQTDKANYNRKQIQNNNFGAVNYDLEQREAETIETKNDMRNRDQRLFASVITMLITADSKQELDEMTQTISAKVAEGSTSQMGILREQVVDGVNTALPFGVRRIHCFRSLTTESLAAFMPFNAREIRQAGGLYYGSNAISHNMIFINREELQNGNCIILGTSGGGKSFFAKEEVLKLILRIPNADVLIIDPEREYMNLTYALNGEVIRVSSSSNNHINAMDMSAEYSGDNANPIATKSEFLMSLCEQILESKASPRDKSIIDRCAAHVYGDYIRSGYKSEPPTLQQFREALLEQPEQEAKELALAIEMFTEGSLNTFAQPTSVDTNNRLICYDILDLGDSLMPVGMLVVLDSILNRITSNRAKGRRTYIFIDEIYLLFAHEYSSNFLYTLFKRVRKYGAAITGITQNVEDMLRSANARAMLSNSNFVVMLNQNGSDRQELANLLSISENQMQYFSNVEAGHGLLKVGADLIPYVNEFPHNSLYKLMTTKPSETM